MTKVLLRQAPSCTLGSIDTVLQLFNSLPHKSRPLTTQRKKTFEKIVGKGENAGNQHFLLFQQCFSIFTKTKFKIGVKFSLSSAIAFNLNMFKFLLFNKDLKVALQILGRKFYKNTKNNHPYTPKSF